jgi:hypothetical protein
MKTKILIVLILVSMLLATQSGRSQDILFDGSFSTTTEIVLYPYDPPPMNIWCSYQNYGIEAYASVVNNACFYQVTYAGYDAWEVQLTQYGFTLETGHNYRLSFDVKADADRPFGVFLGEFWGNWTNLLGWDRYIQYATTEWQTITLDFKATCLFDVNKISFEIGGINTNMYFDNIFITDLGAYQPSIGILGNSIFGWDVDVDMLTSDGITYTLSNFPLATGRVKFRQDDMWCFNWGGISFPSGSGMFYGPDIIVTNPGYYDIVFNRITGDYIFTCIGNCSPYIGIIGTAVPPNFDTGPDVDMITNDGIVYTLQAYNFTDGLAKFRQDDSWAMNWGNTTFPTGTAILNGTGNDIPVAAGKYTVTFNIVTGDYSFSFPSIGILGSALNGWTDDIDLTTTDGVNYTLSSYPFTDGEVKFRQGNEWYVNWGGYTFPSGYGWQDGPNIPIPAGTYDVRFNSETGEYLFTATSCPVPGISCPYGLSAGTDPGTCGALIFYPEVVPSPNCGGAGVHIEQLAGLPSGSVFPVGSTLNSYTLTNAAGNTATCDFDIFVYDWEQPVIWGFNEYLDPLWPPNHKMVLVPINYNSYDNCGATFTELYVYSNEPVSGTGAGDLQPDWIVVDEHSVWLRAERAGNGNGREYHVVIICRDENWNYTSQEVIVPVPHDQGKVKAEINETAEIPNADNSLPTGSGFNADIWPNPTRQGFEMEVASSSEGKVSFSVCDMTGRIVLRSETNINQIIHFGEDFLPGIYILQILQGDNTWKEKIVKQ